MSTAIPKHRASRSGFPEEPGTDQAPAERPPRSRALLGRHWPRRVLISVNVLVCVCLAAAASAYEYVQHEIGSIATAPSPGANQYGHDVDGHRVAQVDYSGGLSPENILLIGNQTRQGLTPAQQLRYGLTATHSGTLADIMMVLHLDPAKDAASILSIPRDLFAPMPAGSLVGPYQKMDAALNDGNADGPDNLMKAVQEDLGIPINHFMELNFNGFINSVNALGGIRVYFPEPVWDAESLLYEPNPGCHQLDGTDALALVRARHLQYEPPGTHEPRDEWTFEAQSDLARIVRAHTFMKIVAETAEKEGKADILTANAFLNAVVKQMTVDKGLRSQLLSLVLHYRHMNPSAVAESTLPTSPVNYYSYDGADIGDVLFPVQPLDNDAIKTWDPQALPAPVRPKAVRIVSLTGSYDAAVSAGHALGSDGLDVTGETAGTVPASTTVTFVGYHHGDAAQALYVMKYLSGAVMLHQEASVPLGTVQVELGSSVVVASRPAPGHRTTGAAGAGAKSSTTAAPATSAPAPRAGAGSPHHRAPATTVPTPGGYAPSPAADQVQPWDPRACPASS
ncbi:MAG: LCP family protein [Acidimicrobiales bacterium]